MVSTIVSASRAVAAGAVRRRAAATAGGTSAGRLAGAVLHGRAAELHDDGVPLAADRGFAGRASSRRTRAIGGAVVGRGRLDRDAGDRPGRRADGLTSPGATLRRSITSDSGSGCAVT